MKSIQHIAGNSFIKTDEILKKTDIVGYLLDLMRSRLILHRVIQKNKSRLRCSITNNKLCNSNKSNIRYY